MQIALGVSVLVEFIEKDEKCNYKPEKTNWKVNLSGSGKILGDNLKNKPDATSVDDLSRTSYPSQAHHLIPNARLNPNAKGADDNPPHLAHKLLMEGSILYADTDYDINHKNNGKWMPYAHRLKEWVSASKAKTMIAGKSKEAADKIKLKIKSNNKKLVESVMRASNIQIHQGSHSYKRFGKGEAGYLTRVDQYLDKIRNHGISHFASKPGCKDCADKKKDNLYPPRENTIRYFDEASRLINIDINLCRIFVSEAASKFHEDFKFEIEE